MRTRESDLLAFHRFSFSNSPGSPFRFGAPRISFGVLLLAAFLAGHGLARAQGTFEAIQNYSASGIVGDVPGTAGWSFQTTIPITVTALGCFTNVLGNQNMVLGLWGADGTLLASNLVTTLSSLAGLSRYESVNPVFLDPGQTYYVGAYSPSGSISPDIYLAPGTPPLVVAPEITLEGLAAGTNGFGFPTAQPGTLGDVYLAPNFQFQDRVPEPSALSLFAMLTGLLAAFRPFSRGVRRP